MATATKTVIIEASHQSGGPRGICWVTPVGWEPVKPAEFAGDEYSEDEGSIWGDEEEEAGIVCLDPLVVGERTEVNLDRLSWVYSNCCDYRPFADVEAR